MLFALHFQLEQIGIECVICNFLFEKFKPACSRDRVVKVIFMSSAGEEKKRKKAPYSAKKSVVNQLMSTMSTCGKLANERSHSFWPIQHGGKAAENFSLTLLSMSGILRNLLSSLHLLFNLIAPKGGGALKLEDRFFESINENMSNIWVSFISA